MAIPESIEFSLRDWFGLVAGISWGLVLGRFFAAGDMTVARDPVRPAGHPIDLARASDPELATAHSQRGGFQCGDVSLAGRPFRHRPLWALWCG